MKNTRALIKGFLFLLFLIISPQSLFADTGPKSVKFPTYVPGYYNGPSENRIDLLIIAEGYSGTQDQLFQTHVNNLVAGIFNEEPFKEYKRYFNVIRLFTVSTDSGADHPEFGVEVNTSFDASFNYVPGSNPPSYRYLQVGDTTRLNNVLNTLQPTSRDLVLVLVNDLQYGGTGGSVAIVSQGSGSDVIKHEYGHTLGLLADEYDYDFSCNPNGPFEPNIWNSTDLQSIPWKHWINANTPIPTPEVGTGVAGLFQGGRYCTSALYRPTNFSKMQANAYPFEQVNTEQLVKRFYNYVSTFDSTSPTNDVLITSGQTQPFSVTPLLPLTTSLQVSWYVDNVLQPATGTTFNLNTAGMTSGAHTVKVVVKDQTLMVRNDPAQLLMDNRTWNLTISSTPTVGVGVYSPIDQKWWLRTNISEGNPQLDFTFEPPVNAPNRIAVVGDWDGNGVVTPGFYNPDTGTWYLRNSNSSGPFDTSVQYGWVYYKPVVGDWDGNGTWTIGVYDPIDHLWRLRNSNTPGNPDINVSFEIPAPNRIAIVGDWDGNGSMTPGFYDPDTAKWYLRNSNTNGNADIIVDAYGSSFYLPVVGDWDANGTWTIGAYEPGNGKWYLRNDNSPGTPNIIISYGWTPYKPVVGRWQ
jgi:hypothetical protein